MKPMVDDVEERPMVVPFHHGMRMRLLQTRKLIEQRKITNVIRYWACQVCDGRHKTVTDPAKGA